MKIRGNTTTVLIMLGIVVSVFVGYGLIHKNKNDVQTFGTAAVNITQKQKKNNLFIKKSRRSKGSSAHTAILIILPCHSAHPP